MTGSSTMDRRAAVARLLADRGDLLVVSGLGGATYDVFAAGDSAGNFYLWGAMGSAALVGLGLAKAQADRRVIAITGDGEQLMGLGGLATIAVACPRNLTIVVVDNGRFGETGMQVSQTGHGIDLAAAANALGFAFTAVAWTLTDVEVSRAQMYQVDGPALIVLKVDPKECARSLPPRDGVYLKNRFRRHIGLPPA